MERAKVFWSGRSQAVLLPKRFRLDGDKVHIRRHGNAVILEPIARDWTWLDALVGDLDEDFVQAVGGQQPAEPVQLALDKMFR